MAQKNIAAANQTKLSELKIIRIIKSTKTEYTYIVDSRRRCTYITLMAQCIRFYDKCMHSIFHNVNL